MRSWLSRLSARRRRPSVRIGATTSGTPMSTSAVSLGLVTKSSTSPPASTRRLRSATETDEPITDRTSVVSVVSRDSTSPVMIRS